MKSYEEKSEDLKNKLLEIEKKHFDYFKNREPVFESDGDRDHLHNHWILYADGHFVKFGFGDNSELPEYIRDECNEAFKEVFG